MLGENLFLKALEKNLVVNLLELMQVKKMVQNIKLSEYIYQYVEKQTIKRLRKRIKQKNKRSRRRNKKTSIDKSKRLIKSKFSK